MYVVTFKIKRPYADSIQVVNEQGRAVVVRFQAPQKLNFNVSSDGVMDGECKMFEVQNETMALDLAHHLATNNPGCEVCVSKVVSIYQSETPKIVRKNVTEKGTLPA